MGGKLLAPVRILELLVVALAGAGIALGAAAAFGKLGDHTTVQQVTSPTQTMAHSTAPAPAAGLTPEKIYGQDAPGVVQITATTLTQGQTDPYGFPAAPTTEQSLGSGFVIAKAGHIVTNFHVVQGAERVQVSFSGQDQLNARVVGKDPSTDVAVLKIDAHARALTPLPLGDSDAATVGDAVYAIGNPFGFTRTLTTGVVSAVQRQLQGPTSLPIEHAIQTDAAINHGNSGGPLIDADGRVIGITSQISTGNTGGQGNVGIGFAIPINTVRNVVAQIIKTGKVEHAFLGIETTQVTAQLAKIFNLPAKTGLLVATVTKNSGAAKAGLEGGTTTVVVGGVSYRLGGDIIVGIDDTPIATYEQLRDAVAQKRPGDKVKLQVLRQGSKKTVTVILGQAPK
jgi:S1-C subfamily serine protease